MDLLKKIILDYQELKLEPGIPRHLDVVPVPEKATICIGVHRSTVKTFVLQNREDADPEKLIFTVSLEMTCQKEKRKNDLDNLLITALLSTVAMLIQIQI